MINIKQHLNIFREYGNNVIVDIEENDQLELIELLKTKLLTTSPFKIRVLEIDAKEIMWDLSEVIKYNNQEYGFIKEENKEKNNTKLNRYLYNNLKEELLIKQTKYSNPIVTELIEKYFSNTIYLKMIENLKSKKEETELVLQNIEKIRKLEIPNKNFNPYQITEKLFEQKNVIYHVIIKNAHYIDDYDVQKQMNMISYNSNNGICINIMTKANHIYHNQIGEDIKKKAL